jgi:hypothetical protein
MDKNSTLIKSKMLGVRLTEGELNCFKNRAFKAGKTASELARDYFYEILREAELTAKKTTSKWLINR